MKYKDISNLRYNRLLATEYIGSNTNGDAIWRCVCDCGNTINVLGRSLRSQHTKSCGCLNVEQISVLGKNRRLHGDGKARLYNIWRNMLRRCDSPVSTSYKWYGAKGIKVFDDWKDYLLFKEWALGAGYSENLTIDRLDSSSDYIPDNCQWIPLSDNISKSSKERWSKANV